MGANKILTFGQNVALENRLATWALNHHLNHLPSS